MKKFNLVIYHFPCADGFTSAYIAQKALGEDGVKYIGMNHGDLVPMDDVYDSDILILDFSFSPEIMKIMCERAKSVIILDHHASARNALSNFKVGNSDFTFDMTRSGARMTWDYFYSGQEPSKLIKYVEDQDLGKFSLPNSREINAAIFAVYYDFDDWAYLEEQLTYKESFELLKVIGSAILNKQYKDLEEMVEKSTLWWTVDGHSIPVVNTNYFNGSIVCEILLNKFLDRPFAGFFYYDQKGCQLSLRSRGDFDVSEICVKYGGGGHSKSARMLWKCTQ